MNKKVFKTQAASKVPETDTINEAGGKAYALSDQAALSQIALTGCISDTYYVSAQQQVSDILDLANKVPVTFLAQLAGYARANGFMKDTPAVLLAILVQRDPTLARKVAPKVLTDAKMVRNFVQAMRSGVLGRKSLGTTARSIVRQWLKERTDEQLFKASVGNDPSLADVIKLTHPSPASAKRRALYGYLLGKEPNKPGKKSKTVLGYEKRWLPDLVKEFETFKAHPVGSPPEVPFQMLSSLTLTDKQWYEIALNQSWQTVRMNLNTFARNGVFKIKGATEKIAARLRDPAEIRRAKLFPYQLLMAYRATEPGFNSYRVERGEEQVEIPEGIRNALQDAMEVAVENVPWTHSRVVVCPDVSGSMSGNVVTGQNGKPTRVRCVDVAALVASMFLRVNPETMVIPFDGNVERVPLNGRDSIMTNAQKLAAVGGGSTNCSAPLAHMNANGTQADLVIYVSDNESWVDRTPSYYHRGTGMLHQWDIFKRNNPKAKLVCIDLVPNTSTQARDRTDILNVGGFSDNVFEVINAFLNGDLGGEHLVKSVKEFVI